MATTNVHRGARFISLAVLISMALLSGVSCAKDKAMILEKKDVQFFKVSEVDSNPEILEISGLSFHSSLGVSDVRSVVSGDKVQVLVYLRPAVQGLSGNFRYTVKVSSTIEKVTFGEENVEVWHRKK